MNTIKQISASCLVTVLFLSVHAADVDVGDGANDNTYTDATAYAGATKIVKTGTGKTTLNFGTYATQPAFSGEIEVQQGTLAVYGIQNLGSPTKITVAAGATLDLTTQQPDQAANLQATEIVIEGTGVGDAGALVRGGPTGVNSLFKILTLNNHAKISFGVQTGLVANDGRVKLNGHTLTKTGAGKFYCNNTQFLGTDGTTADPGNIVVAAGALFLHNGNALKGGSEKNTVTLKNGTTLQLRNTNPVMWKIKAESKAMLYCDDHNPSGATRNRFAGPVEFTDDCTLRNDNVAANLALVGAEAVFGHAAAVTWPGPVSFLNETVRFTSAARVTVENADVASLTIGDGSTMKADLSASDRAQTRIYAGSAAGTYGIVTIEAGCTVTNFGLSLGMGGCGALYQRGGVSFWPVSNAAYDRCGDEPDAYGYLGATGGRFVFDGDASAATRRAHFARQGTFVMASQGGGQTMFATSANVAFGMSGGTLAWYQDGGSTASFDDLFSLGTTDSSGAGGRAQVTVRGEGTVLSCGKYMRVLWDDAGAVAILNLNRGGTLKTQCLYRWKSTPAFYLNLDGGVIMPTLANAVFMQANDEYRKPVQSTVYENGFVIDTSDTRNQSGNPDKANMQFSFVAPGAGKRVAAVALPAASGFASEKIVGSPVVTITGDGAGASAFALFDDTTRIVTNIVVTSPGWGYTSASATLSSGGLTNEYACAVTLEDQPADGWKGFTKRGAPRLDMLGANAFKGDVTVEDGVLAFMNGNAAQGGMPQGAGVTIAEGATLTFATMHEAVTVPFLAGCGATSYGDFTVTNRIECAADDIFAGKSLTIGQNLTLADGVKIVVTDPENLAKYRNSKAATVVACGKTVTANGTVSLAFGAPCDTEDISAWNLQVKQDSIMLGHMNGTVVIFR